MDLTIKVEEGYNLSLRAVVIIKTEKGYVFEDSKKGYLFCTGGRVKLDESSLEAAKRELKEETNQDGTDFEFVSIIENFFTAPERITGIPVKVQEINFVYKAKLSEPLDTSLGMLELTEEEIGSQKILPEIIKDIVLGKTKEASFVTRNQN